MRSSHRHWIVSGALGLLGWVPIWIEGNRLPRTSLHDQETMPAVDNDPTPTWTVSAPVYAHKHQAFQEALDGIQPAAAGAGSLSAPIVTLQALELSEEQERRIYEASEVLVGECMGQRGWAYEPSLFKSQTEQDIVFEPSVEGAVDAAVGYGIALNADRQQQPRPTVTNDARLGERDDGTRDEFDLALQGQSPPAGATLEEVRAMPELAVVQLEDGETLMWDPRSCVAWARDQLYGDDWTALLVADRLEARRKQAQQAAGRRPEVVAALDRWRQCVSDGGYDSSGPEYLVDDLLAARAEGKLTIEEIATTDREIAQVVTRCRRASGLLQARQDARAAEMRALELDAQDLLEQMQRLNHRALMQAELALNY